MNKSADLFTFTEENLNGKLYFLWSDISKTHSTLLTTFHRLRTQFMVTTKNYYALSRLFDNLDAGTLV